MGGGKHPRGRVTQSTPFGPGEIASLDLLGEPPLQQPVQLSDHQLPDLFLLYG